MGAACGRIIASLWVARGRITTSLWVGVLPPVAKINRKENYRDKDRKIA